MSDCFKAHPEHQEEDKCIVFLDDGRFGGLVIVDYEDDKAAIVNLLMHLKAMFKANGMDMDLMTLGQDGVTRG
jgi:hypothetical protein